MWNKITSSKIVDKHIKQKQRRMHQQRVKNIKSIMNLNQPFKPKFLFNNKKHLLKKIQAQNDINRKNFILLLNMKSILRNSQNYWRKKQRSQTSNSQNRKRFSQMIRLNKKIDQQNIIIGRRLHTVHSEYQGISTLYLKNPSSHNQFLKVSSLNRSRPLSGRTTLKVKTVENNAVGDLDNQFINTQNFNPIYKQQKKQRCQTAIRKKIYTQNTQQS